MVIKMFLLARFIICGLGVLMLYSTSGNSENVLEAARCGRERKLHVNGFSGEKGGRLKEYCDQLIAVPSTSTPRIQEMHLLIGHLICEEVERIHFSTKL